MVVVRGLIVCIQGTTAALMLTAVALNFANIIGRYVLLRPVPSAEEVMLFLMVGTVFLGNAVVGFEGKQLRMDVIIGALPAKLRRMLEVAGDLTMCRVRKLDHSWLAGSRDAGRVRPTQRSGEHSDVHSSGAGTDRPRLECAAGRGAAGTSFRTARPC